MSETFECGDTGALVAYLYEECEPEIREVIATHLSRCESCSSEVDGLGWTRRRLQAWTPPVSELGFQLPVTTQEPRLPWWRAPLPAWAQAVAALVIFGVGLSMGLARGPASASPQVSSMAARHDQDGHGIAHRALRTGEESEIRDDADANRCHDTSTSGDGTPTTTS